MFLVTRVRKNRIDLYRTLRGLVRLLKLQSNCDRVQPIPKRIANGLVMIWKRKRNRHFQMFTEIRYWNSPFGMKTNYIYVFVSARAYFFVFSRLFRKRNIYQICFFIEIKGYKILMFPFQMTHSNQSHSDRFVCESPLLHAVKVSKRLWTRLVRNLCPETVAPCTLVKHEWPSSCAIHDERANWLTFK